MSNRAQNQIFKPCEVDHLNPLDTIIGVEHFEKIVLVDGIMDHRLNPTVGFGWI